MSTENNFNIKDDIDSERDHPVPNLVNKTNDDACLTPNEMIDKMDNLPDANTDALFALLGNPEKTKHNVESFQKQEYSSSSVHNTTYEPPRVSNINQSNTTYTQQSHNQHNDKRNSTDEHTTVPEETKENIMIKKLDMIRKLGELRQSGVKLSQNYSMFSDYQTMKYEYELHKSIRDKNNTIDWLGKIIGGGCYFLERGNEKFNPFDFELNGWSENVQSDIHQNKYHDVLGELYEKYFKAGKPMSPEVKLIGMVGLSALTFHLAHTMLNNQPSAQTMLNNNPELAQKLTQQAAETIKRQNDQYNQTLNDRAKQDHDAALKKMNDLNMLKKKREEFTKQQQLEQKKKEVEEIQNELNNIRSESISMYTQSQNMGNQPQNIVNQQTMRGPSVHLLNRIQQQPQNINYTSPLFNAAEKIRQEQMINARDSLQYINSTNNISDTPSHDGESKTGWNPNIESILANGLNVGQNDSTASNNSNTRRRRRRKNKIKVNTN